MNRTQRVTVGDLLGCRAGELPSIGSSTAIKHTIKHTIYLASSWRNEHQPEVLRVLRAAGHTVYDFRNPAPGSTGFGWRQITAKPTAEWTPDDLAQVLRHPIAKRGHGLDQGGMDRATACVLLLPCGSSAHLEAGWCAGRGVPTIVYAPSSIREPELMYLTFGTEPIVTTERELLERLAKAPPRVGNSRRAIDEADRHLDDDREAVDDTHLDEREFLRGDVEAETLDLSEPGVEEPQHPMATAQRDRLASIVAILLRDAVVLAGGDAVMAAFALQRVRDVFSAGVATLMADTLLVMDEEVSIDTMPYAEIVRLVGRGALYCQATSIIFQTRLDVLHALSAEEQ